MSVWAARKGGNFYYRFTVKGEVFTGTFEGCTDERAAKRLERDLREQKKAEKRLGAKAASTSSSGGRSVAAALAGYIKAHENEGGYNIATWKVEKQKLKDFCALVGLTRQIRDVSFEDVQEAVRKVAARRCLNKETRQRGGYVNRYTWKLFRRVHRHAHYQMHEAVKPILWADLARKENGPRDREITLTEEAALKAVPNRWVEGYSDVYEFLMLGGTRLMNIVVLWTQVDWSNREIKITQKGGSTHTVTISDPMLALLQRQIGKHPTHVFTYIAKRSRLNPKTGRMEVTGERYPVTPAGFDSWFDRVKRAAGLVDIRNHDTRRTSGGRLLRATGNLKLVQKHLGHSDISVTAAHYAHVPPSEMLDQLNRAHALTEARREVARKLLARD
jgi:integrase